MNILLLDIETAPNKAYVWGLFKQNVHIDQIVESGYTMCWSAKWLGKKEVMFSSMMDGEERMLKKMHKLLEEADAVVHYNGVKFDIPTLNKEFALYDMPPPAPFHNIDMLRTVRSRFKFPSNKLDYVAQEFGLGGKVKHKGMLLWEECMNGDVKAWKQMERYNKQDVKLLEKLYKKLLPWIDNHPNHALYTDGSRPVCTNCGSHHVLKVGTTTTKTQIYQRYRCKKCQTPLRGRYTQVGKEHRENILTQDKVS